MRSLIFLSFVLFCCFSSLNAQQTVGLFQNDSLASNGYTLFTSNTYRWTYLLDNCGEVVHTWPNDQAPGLSTYLLENGNLLKTAQISNNVFSGGGSGGRLELYDWDNNLLWQYDYSSESHHQHHDIEPLPNGNILILAWEFRTEQEAIDAGRDPIFVFNELWPTQVVEIEPVGADGANVVWEWHLWDHLVQEYDSTKANYGVVAEHPELVDLNFTPQNESSDWIHANSIDYNADLDQIIINSRNFGEFWIIDHSTTTAEAASHDGGNSGKGGDILYRWGNPRAYDRGIPSTQVFFAAHDAHWIPEGLPDAGKIMVFNNGFGRLGNLNYSTVEVLDPPVNGSGDYPIAVSAPFGPIDVYWKYPNMPDASFYSPNISGAQRLPNGNTLICEGASGHFFEVDPMGITHWDYVSPLSVSGAISQGESVFNNAVFRVHRYAPDYPAFQGKDLTPSGPIELNPYPSTCKITGPVTGIEEVALEGKITFPTRILTEVIPVINKTGEELRVEIFDVMGRVLLSDMFRGNHLHIPVQNAQTGIYFIRFSIPGQRTFMTKKFLKQ